MMARRTFGRGIAGMLAGGVMAALPGCNPFGGNSLRYKTTVEVDTPQGVKTGFAVRQLDYHANDGGWFPLGESRASTDLKGEAVAVDIAPNRILFALLTGANGNVDYAKSDITGLLREFGGAEQRAQIELWPAMPQTKEPVIGNPLPMLVMFTDIRDPKSVTRVDPADMAATFGAGVKLRRITVAVTQEAVTTGIGERLGWLGEYYAKRLDGQRFGDGLSFSNSMSSGAFSTEANK